ncbi:MAG: carboxypeptidase regulatory-like domain-containing protein, partial [Bryobacteraceae bacterium]|nr:carboxypeptidase regulatory-like domain-containing protein [Bryobacteraceae bacterium]
MLQRTAALLLLLSGFVFSQTTTIQGSIVGNVSDPTGGAITAASITATNTRTNISVQSKSDGSGFYRVEPLLSGPYRLSVEHPNFKALVRDGLMLSSDQTLRVEARLEVGSVSEKVEVVGESSMIETDSAQINHVRSWDNRKFLLTRGLDFFSTVALEPGTTTGDPSFEV